MNIKERQFSHIILLILIKTVALIHTISAIKIKCSNTDDYYFTSPGVQCGSYYKCASRGQRNVLQCPRGQKFDFYKQSCSHSPGKCQEPSCIERENGIYPDYSHACMRSFQCLAGQLTSLDNCPTKQLHNGQKCVQQDLVNCIEPSTTTSAVSFPNDKRCANRLGDGIYASGDNCNEYVECTNGRVTYKWNCPLDYAFDGATQQCLPKHLVPNCGKDLMEEQLCRSKRDGLIADPKSKDCSTYIVCRSGNLESQQRCSHQAVFNGEICVPSPLFECSLSKRHTELIDFDQCQSKSNGYYSYPQHGCTSYIRCMSERTIQVGVCPKDQYFDMEIRKCVYEKNLERRRCFERGVSGQCSNRSDGYYPESSCDRYFYCHSGNKIEYKCISGKVFNGQRCVPKREYECPKAENDAFCNSRTDGYYKDSNDGCRAYSYCSSGHKVTYICEQGYVFNDQNKKCVHKDMLATNDCFNSDQVCYGKSNGYHADLESNCQSYVYCVNYEKITKITCRDRKVFNGQKCVSPSQYTCPSLLNYQQSNCVPQKCLKRCESNGFYHDLSSGCRDFYICINGKATKVSCQPGMRFNGEICVSEDKVHCPVICAQNYNVERECTLGGHYS